MLSSLNAPDARCLIAKTSEASRLLSISPTTKGTKVFTISVDAHSSSISKLGITGGVNSHSGSQSSSKLVLSQGQSPSKPSIRPSQSLSISSSQISAVIQRILQAQALSSQSVAPSPSSSIPFPQISG